jgi:uncharacterized protein (DUF1015 family)
MQTATLQQTQINTEVLKVNEDKLKNILNSSLLISLDLQQGAKKSLIINKITQKLKRQIGLTLVSASEWYETGVLKSHEYTEDSERSYIKEKYSLIDAQKLRKFLLY